MKQASRRLALGLLGVMPVFARTAFAAAAPAKIGMVGAGRMGTPIGTLLAKAGHEVMFSSRHPENLKPLIDGAGSKARAGTVADAVAFGDVIILTLPYSALPDLAKEHGKALAAKRLVIDVGNPYPQRDGEPATIARDVGPGPYVTSLMPGIKLVRAFNAINWQKLPEFAARSVKVAAPICGDDKAVVALAEALIREIGFEPVMIGPCKTMSKFAMPGSPLDAEHTVEDAKKIVASLPKA